MKFSKVVQWQLIEYDFFNWTCMLSTRNKKIEHVADTPLNIIVIFWPLVTLTLTFDLCTDCLIAFLVRDSIYA